jgi:hypothetical protein
MVLGFVTFMKKGVGLPAASVALILAVRAQYEEPLWLMPWTCVPGGSSEMSLL